MTYLIYYIYHRLNIKLNTNNLFEIDNYVLNTINALDYSFSYSFKMDSKFMGLLVFVFANISCGLFNFVLWYLRQNNVYPCVMDSRNFQILLVSLHLFLSTVIPSVFHSYFIKNK